jgi:hypothetical protein
MKKYIFTFLTFFAFISLKAQDFVGKDANLYLNATVKPIEIREILQEYAYKNFYLNFDTATKVLTKERIGKRNSNIKPFQTGVSYNPVSDYSKLVGMEFKVIGVYEEAAKYDFEKGRYYVFALENDALGTIYYEYDTEFKHNLELTVVGGLKFPEDYWCNKFTIHKDKFEDKTSYYSPQESGFSVIKIVSNGITKYYLKVEAGGSTPKIDGKGLYLLFDDGSKINKRNEEIDLDVGNNGGYIYSAFTNLSNEDLEILKTKKLTDKRLYIYDGIVEPESANIIQEYIKCVLME